jgi:acetoin utilization deacetylase AcuC-like enzyme
MKIICHEQFYESGYADDCAAVPGRLEAIMSVLGADRAFEIIRPQPADEGAVLLAHTQAYIDTVKTNVPLYDMAILAAGAAIAAANVGIAGEPAFACLRPPGHHAYRESAWGYCVFCNIGIALLQLKRDRRIASAFILDFDAHTGDGTRDVLSDWGECYILNPFAGDSEAYISEIQEFLKGIPAVDIVGVCAGFDSYTKDIGRKLTTFDFYRIGVLMKQFAARASQQRRFAVLEGGYYLPDLGKNVLAFCQGFQ